MRARKPPASTQSLDEARRSHPDGDAALETDAEAAQSHPPDEGDDTGDVRICLACASDGREPGACEHAEVAVFRSPTASVRRAIERSRRAIAEARAAERALRSVLATECARDRAEAELRPPPPPPPAPPALCAVCAAGPASETAGNPSSGAARKNRKRARTGIGQATFSFAADAVPADAEAAPAES